MQTLDGRFVSRPGPMVPLIAADELPGYIDLGIPRELHHEQAKGMVNLGSIARSTESYTVHIVAPDGPTVQIPSSQTSQNPIADPPRIDAGARRSDNPSKHGAPVLPAIGTHPADRMKAHWAPSSQHEPSRDEMAVVQPRPTSMTHFPRLLTPPTPDVQPGSGGSQIPRPSCPHLPSSGERAASSSDSTAPAAAQCRPAPAPSIQAAPKPRANPATGGSAASPSTAPTSVAGGIIVPRQLPSHSHAPPPLDAEYCRHWCRFGTCKWNSQCRYRHQMPGDLPGLLAVGLTSFPAWWLRTLGLPTTAGGIGNNHGRRGGRGSSSRNGALVISSGSSHDKPEEKTAIATQAEGTRGLSVTGPIASLQPQQQQQQQQQQSQVAVRQVSQLPSIGNSNGAETILVSSIPRHWKRLGAGPPAMISTEAMIRQAALAGRGDLIFGNNNGGSGNGSGPNIIYYLPGGEQQSPMRARRGRTPLDRAGKMPCIVGDQPLVLSGGRASGCSHVAATTRSQGTSTSTVSPAGQGSKGEEGEGEKTGQQKLDKGDDGGAGERQEPRVDDLAGSRVSEGVPAPDGPQNIAGSQVQGTARQEKTAAVAAEGERLIDHPPSPVVSPGHMNAAPGPIPEQQKQSGPPMASTPALVPAVVENVQRDLLA